MHSHAHAQSKDNETDNVFYGLTRTLPRLPRPLRGWRQLATEGSVEGRHPPRVVMLRATQGARDGVREPGIG